MLVSFLFWNIFKRPIQARVAAVARDLGVDVVMLAECAVAPEEVVQALNEPTAQFHFPHSEGHKLRIFTRFRPSVLIDEFNDPIGGLTIRSLKVGPHPGLILAVAHLARRASYWDRDDQTLESTVVAHDIIRVEEKLGHARTILVGDLNMNPFDPGVTGAQALHGVMTKKLAAREERDVRGRPYRFFYNPMWGHFGDRTGGPPGSYYLQSSKPGNYFWNIYDQVLLRPELMDTLRELRIVEGHDERSLLTAHGLPDEANGSDHLPVLFRLEI